MNKILRILNWVIFAISTSVLVASLFWNALDTEKQCQYSAFMTTDFDRPSIVEMCQP